MDFQLTSTMYEIHDVFSMWSVSEKMAAIAKTRQFHREKMQHTTPVCILHATQIWIKLYIMLNKSICINSNLYCLIL